MEPHRVDELIDALARPVYVHRMNYSLAQAEHPLSRSRKVASTTLVARARNDIDEIVRNYVRDSR